jgi:hypothetical protein
MFPRALGESNFVLCATALFLTGVLCRSPEFRISICQKKGNEKHWCPSNNIIRKIFELLGSMILETYRECLGILRHSRTLVGNGEPVQ